MRLISAVSRVRVPSPLSPLQRNNVETRSVLVTGASSGIGRDCALLLASRGFKVFAGVRRTEDAAALKAAAQGDLVPVLMDVTIPSTVQAAARSVEKALPAEATFSLVNNAGMTVAGPLEILPLESLRQQFEVNVIGPVAVTQAFLPLLRARRGRILIMGSVLGRLSLPLVAPYAAAKFALEAITDSLSLELRPWGIKVVLLEPGNIATPIWEKSKKSVLELLDALDSEGRRLYDGTRGDIERLVKAFTRGGIPPQRVAKTVVKALTARRPRTRYRVGMDSRFLCTFAPLSPDRLRYWLVRRVLSLR
jgi:NAD(P)-dependent dehydrogenase (short-subunit alcohol dehydrogenase family)